MKEMTMKTRTLWFSFVIVLLAAAAAALAAGAQQQGYVRHPGPMAGGVPPGPPGPPMAMLERLLQLTDEQKTALKAVHEEQRAAAEPLFDQLRTQREAVRAALEVDSPDPTLVGQAMIAAHGVEKQLDQLHAAGREKLVALLTEEQRRKLEAFEKEHGPVPPGRGMRMRLGPPPHEAPGHAHEPPHD
jgi:Spy/CpxP family protein refolding chaperone